MADYLKTVIGAVILISFLVSVLPKEGTGKYAHFAAGLLVLAVVLLPLFRLTARWDVTLSEIPTKSIKTSESTYLMDEFEKNLSFKISEKMKAETGIAFDVTVFAKTDKDGSITGVERVEITPFSNKYAETVSAYVGITVSKVEEKR